VNEAVSTAFAEARARNLALEEELRQARASHAVERSRVYLLAEKRRSRGTILTVSPERPSKGLKRDLRERRRGPALAAGAGADPLIPELLWEVRPGKRLSQLVTAPSP